MIMKKTNLFVLLLSLLGANLGFASDGAGSTGGGFAVDCPATPVSSPEITLLDLYEIQKQGMQLIPTTGDLAEDYFNSVDNTYTLQGRPNLAEELRANIFNNLKITMQSVKFVTSARDLPQINDVGKLPWIPSQCQLKQIALYDDKAGIIFILKSAWDRLDSQNKAALVQHELFGKSGRRLGEVTTQLARSSVGHTFSELSGIRSLKDGLTGSAKRYFSGSFPAMAKQNLSSIFIQRYNASSLNRIQFISMFGKSMLTKTWIDIPLDIEITMVKAPTESDPFNCILDNQNLDKSFRVPVEGSMAAGAEIEIHFETGKHIELKLFRNNSLISTNTISTCSGL